MMIIPSSLIGTTNVAGFSAHSVATSCAWNVQPQTHRLLINEKISRLMKQCFTKLTHCGKLVHNTVMAFPVDRLPVGLFINNKVCSAVIEFGGYGSRCLEDEISCTAIKIRIPAALFTSCCNLKGSTTCDVRSNRAAVCQCKASCDIHTIKSMGWIDYRWRRSNCWPWRCGSGSHGSKWSLSEGSVVQIHRTTKGCLYVEVRRPCREKRREIRTPRIFAHW